MNQSILNFGTYPQEFILFLANNPAIWKRFEIEANRVWNRGFRHYGAKTIVEYIRHETSLYEQGGDFKINNSHTSSLARYYIELHPERACLFELRARKCEAAAA